MRSSSCTLQEAVCNLQISGDRKARQIPCYIDMTELADWSIILTEYGTPKELEATTYSTVYLAGLGSLGSCCLLYFYFWRSDTQGTYRYQLGGAPTHTVMLRYSSPQMTLPTIHTDPFDSPSLTFYSDLRRYLVSNSALHLCRCIHAYVLKTIINPTLPTDNQEPDPSCSTSKGV